MPTKIKETHHPHGMMRLEQKQIFALLRVWEW